jgi:peptide/nickel transport system permease protein
VSAPAAPLRRTALTLPRPRGVWAFVLRRVLLGLLTLFLVSIVVFAATQALPGDAARAILGRNATPSSLAALRQQLHLDRPVLSQYFGWLGGCLEGNLGRSLVANEPVTTLIGKRIENSAFLMLLAGVISIPLSIALGSVAARRRDRAFDHATTVILLAFAALPEFVTAIALVVLFGTSVFQILPAVSLIPPNDAPWAHLKELVLPTAALVLAVSPYIARIMRASMVEVLESDYVEMARLKGLPERTVLWRHALPNGIAPAIQVIALNLAYLAGGIVVVEFVFSYPGIGSAFVDAVSNRDLPTVQALALLIATSYVVLNVCADVATILVSPRLRTSLQ